MNEQTHKQAGPGRRFLGGVLLAAWLSLAASAPCFGQAKPARTKEVGAADLTIKQIENAMARAVQALYRMEPIYTFPPEHLYHSNRAYGQETRNAAGNHALACWALLAAGETYQNPPFYRRINWVLSSDTPYVYDRGMRATMLNHLPRDRWAPWVQRDGKWLDDALSQAGNYGESYTGTKPTGPGDNANGQYGVLGLWNVAEAGYPVSVNTWKNIDDYWRKAQSMTAGDEPAGWGVYSMATVDKKTQLAFYTRESGPMTGGAVAALSLTERFLYGPQMTDPSKNNMSMNLRKGLRWLDENFTLDDKAEESDWFYYMWCMQRVGGATGYRTFNGVDWFRDVTARILRQQLANGTWQGTQGHHLSTGFALLYLSKANDPLAIAKVRFKTQDKDGRLVDGRWNNRPHDLWNFIDYAGDMYEVKAIWQIAELSQPVYELIESPILYLSTNEAFTLRDTEVNNLRAYLDAGGLLVTNSEDSSGVVLQSVNALVAKLYPGRKLDTIARTHPFYDVHQRLPLGVAMMSIDNGIRPLIVHFTRDISRDLQINNRAQGVGFSALSNVFLYVTGKNTGRTRLGSSYVVQRVEKPTRPVAAARIKHAGRYDPEPGAMTQLKAILANNHNIDLQVTDLSPSELKNTRIAFLTTMGKDARLTDSEARAINDWIVSGGTLWIDPAGGSAEAVESARELLKQIIPNAQTLPLPTRSPIITGERLPGGYNNSRVEYRWYALITMGPRNTPRVEQVDLNGRPAVLFSTEDITCGLAGLDHWGIFGYKPQFARQLVINSILDVAMNPPRTATPAPALPTEPEPTPAAEPAPAAIETPAEAPAAN